MHMVVTCLLWYISTFLTDTTGADSGLINGNSQWKKRIIEKIRHANTILRIYLNLKHKHIFITGWLLVVGTEPFYCNIFSTLTSFSFFKVEWQIFWTNLRTESWEIFMSFPQSFTIFSSIPNSIFKNSSLSKSIQLFSCSCIYHFTQLLINCIPASKNGMNILVTHPTDSWCAHTPVLRETWDMRETWGLPQPWSGTWVSSVSALQSVNREMIKGRRAVRISSVLTRNDRPCLKHRDRRKDPEAGLPGWGTATARERMPWLGSLSSQGVKSLYWASTLLQTLFYGMLIVFLIFRRSHWAISWNNRPGIGTLFCQISKLVSWTSAPPILLGIRIAMRG